jgi:hypothetical protein
MERRKEKQETGKRKKEKKKIKEKREKKQEQEKREKRKETREKRIVIIRLTYPQLSLKQMINKGKGKKVSQCLIL